MIAASAIAVCLRSLLLRTRPGVIDGTDDPSLAAAMCRLEYLSALITPS